MHNKQASCQQGFTLVEAMIVVAIIAVLLAVAVPSFSDFFEKNRLKRAAEEVYGLIAKAKAETVVRNMDLSVSVDTTQWCAGYAAVAACVCDPDSTVTCTVPVAGTAVTEVIDGADLKEKGVTITENFTGTGPTFNSVRGTAGAGTIGLSAGEWDLNVVVSPQGRVKICAPCSSKASMGYPICPTPVCP